MSQINAPQNGPNLNPMDGAQPAQPQAGHAARGGEVQGQRITDVVEQAELLPYQQRRRNRSAAQQVAYVIGRVIGGIVTLGVSEGIIAIGHRAERANAEAQRQAALERRAADAHFNIQLGESLRRNEPLAPQYQAAVQEAIARLREDFGDLVPENANDISQLHSSSDIRYALKSALAAEQGRVEPARLRELLLEKAAPLIREKAVELALEQAFQALGHDADAAQSLSLLLHARPGLKNELDMCIDRAAVDNVIGAWKGDIDAFAASVKHLADGRQAARDHAVATMAAACGISVEDMGRHLNLGKLDIWLAGVEPEIGTPEADIRRECMEKADELIRRKMGLLNSVNVLNVSPELKAYWKERVLADKTLNNPDEFRNAVDVASRVSASKIAGIEELFSSGKPDADTAYAALQSLSLSVDIALTQVHDWTKLDGDEKGLARFHALKALLDRMPAFRAAFESDAALTTAMNERAAEDMDSMDERLELTAEVSLYLIQALKTKSVDNASLAVGIGDLSKMPVPFLAALNHAEAAVRANFADMGLPADLLSFNPGEEASVRFILQQAVSKATEPLTPEQFSELAQRTMNTAAANAVVIARVHELEAGGQPLQRLQDSWMASTLALRHPELNEVFAAGDMATVRAALGELDGELTALVRLQQDMNFAWTAGEDYIYRRMEEATGVGQQELRETLNLSGVTYGGSFTYTQGDRLAMVKNPDTSVLAFPGREELVSELEGIAERFVSRKGALYQTVDDLGLPPAAAAELKAGILKDNSVKMPDFLTRCSDLSKFIAAEPMRELLSRPASKESVLDMIQQMTEQYDAAVSVFFPPKNLSELGPDGARNVLKYTLQIFFARNPSLEGVFQKEFADALSEAQNQEIIRLQERMGDPRLSDEESKAVRDQYVKIAMASAFLPFMTSQV